jgi:hypothetical protein
MKIASLLAFITFIAIIIEPRVLRSMQSEAKLPETCSSVSFSGKTVLIAAAMGGIGYVVYCAQTKPGFSENVRENLSLGLSWTKKRKVFLCLGAVLLAGGCLARVVSSPVASVPIPEISGDHAVQHALWG